MVVLGTEEGEMGELLSGRYGVWDDKKVWEMDNADSCITMERYLNATELYPKSGLKGKF